MPYECVERRRLYTLFGITIYISERFYRRVRINKLRILLNKKKTWFIGCHDT